MRVCEIWGLNQNAGSELIGRFRLDGDTLFSEYTEGHEMAISSIIETPNVSYDAKYDSYTQTEQWFDALPDMYHGSYIWATMIGES